LLESSEHAVLGGKFYIFYRGPTRDKNDYLVYIIHKAFTVHVRTDTLVLNGIAMYPGIKLLLPSHSSIKKLNTLKLLG
jgi:hypothetical protein